MVHRLTKDRVETTVIALFITVLLVSNLVSTKLIGIPNSSIIIDGGTILFPVAYILGDIITEVYGFRKAKFIILCGFMSMLLMSTVVFVIQIIPSAQGWSNQAAYEAILGVVPRIVVGSLIAYLVGQMINAYVMAKMKIASKGEHFWARALGSSAIASLVDTIIFSTIAFYGTIPLDALIGLIVTVYTIKVAAEVLVLPITYRVIRSIKDIEGADYFDTNLSPKTFLKG